MARPVQPRGPGRVLVAEPDADERARLVAVVRRAAADLGREVLGQGAGGPPWT